MRISDLSSDVCSSDLLAWFLISLLRLPSLDHDTFVRWIQSPLTVVPLVMLIANVFWHFRLGLQVAIEAYVHGGGRIAAIIALTFSTIRGAALPISHFPQIQVQGEPV